MKTLLFLSSLLFSATAVFAQETTYEKVFFNPNGFENEQVKVEIDNVVSLPKETKFKMTITNKTNNFIAYNSEESNFEIPGQDVRAKEKSWLIEPLESKSKVMRAFGEGLNDIREFEFVCEGFYEILPQEAMEVQPLRLPPSVNNFEAGPILVVLNKDKRSTGKTNIKWDAKYTGENYAFIYPHNISVLMPDENTYATTETNMDPIVLLKGDEKTFSASWDRMPGGTINDMQKVEMLVQFDEVFIEGVPKKIRGETIEMKWNEAMTAERNK